ncbi:MAG: valine--tRNA ligase [Treponema sp.]|nr:valine--tRNA ligase [Treponema sp.]
MKAIELEKAYAPKNFEDKVYKRWLAEDSFKPAEKAGDPYVIVIPPPNVTGVLHLGHALVVSIIDIIIRFHRMRGESTLWVPGTDHAGIATQNVVEKQLRAKGLNRRELGREKFVEQTWKVKEKHHRIISEQLTRMGASVDWSRERFTMDEGLSRAVREVFVRLYERGLLYKGNYLVNWCSSCGTAIADDEVEHKDTAGKMYHLRYPIVGGKGFIELATTRPETMLGDTAVAVHPDDERYRHLVGEKVLLPLADREIPVIADTYVEKEFGTGVVKITPAHDPNDWDVGKRHNLPVINILTPEGRLNGEAPEKYRNLTVEAGREAVLADLKAGGFFIREEDITHAVGHCYRCGTVIEPFLSEQWFVRMKPLAEKALAAWQRGEIVFYPRKWENTYQHWLLNIRDWCISRQLWWGHRIPAWTCTDCGKISVSIQDLSVCPHCGCTHLEQDPDVLDTWFSSWLWPFSTLGWPEETSDLKRFYPTTALVTGYDIIFFWVSRMIMAGLEFTGKVPFRDIYIHGLIRDKLGRKMSKTLQNGIDPLDIIDEFGADALKFTLAFTCAQGQDLLVDKEFFRLGSKFANKVWNASRYILMNLENRELVQDPRLIPVDRWIYSRLNGAAKAMEEAFLTYRFNDAAQTAYEYFWNDFCDWYVEATKLSFREGAGGEAEKDRAVTVLLDVLAAFLRLLHPLLPYVTEEIYSRLPNVQGEGLLIDGIYPQYNETRYDAQVEMNFGFLQELVRSVRTLRSECTISPEKKIRVLLRPENDPERIGFLTENAGLLKLLAGIGNLEINAAGAAAHFTRPAGSIGLVGKGFEAFVYIAEAADISFLKQKFGKEIEKDRKFAASIKVKLGNEKFLQNAPPKLIEEEKLKMEESLKRTAKLEAYIRDFS